MLTLPLEPTDDLANPAFKDSASCKQWLSQFQLTNLQWAHGVLRTQMDELNRYPMRGLERLHILEQLSETVEHVQADYARKLIAKKLPLNKDELTIFVSIVGLWQHLANGYQRCLQTALAGDQQLVSFTSLLCQRCLLYGGLQIFEYLRTGYEFNTRLWEQLHALYAFSEQQGFHAEKVENERTGEKMSALHCASCLTIYTKMLLACHAHPAQLTRTQLKLLDRWLNQWSDAFTLVRHYQRSKDDAAPLMVDLLSTQGLRPLPLVPLSKTPGQIDQNVRYFAMQPLSKLLRVKTILLQQGQTPQQLDLGDEASSEACVEFLQFLHQCWCEGVGTRLAERNHTAQQAHVCYGLEGIYAHITNKLFKPVARNSGVNELARKQIATFGRVLVETNRSANDSGHPLETWLIENESILGAHMLRSEIAGVRLSPNQIVGVRRADSDDFMVGEISWVHVTQTGQLSAGVRYLPGIVQAVTVQAQGMKVAEPSAPALLLPALAALKTPASLVLPRNWLQRNRVVEITHSDKQTFTVKLGFSVEKGVDYERVSFTLA